MHTAVKVPSYCRPWSRAVQENNHPPPGGLYCRPQPKISGWLALRALTATHFPNADQTAMGSHSSSPRYSIFRGGARDGVAFWAAAARARRRRRRENRRRTVFRRCRARTHRFPKEFFLDRAPKSGWLARHTAADFRFGLPLPRRCIWYP